MTRTIKTTVTSVRCRPVSVERRTILARYKSMASVTAAHLQEKLTAELKATFVQATDLSDGCGQKFSVIIVSPEFEGKSLLERQRAVNACLAEEMSTIHALQMKTWTVSQYEQKKAAQNSQES